MSLDSPILCATKNCVCCKRPMLAPRTSAGSGGRDLALGLRILSRLGFYRVAGLNAILLVVIGLDHGFRSGRGKITVLPSLVENRYNDFGVAARRESHEPGIVLKRSLGALRGRDAGDLCASGLSGHVNAHQPRTDSGAAAFVHH